MAHDVFISYAHENKAMADALCATLERNGLRCWIAPRDVPPGNWGGAIVEAIEASRVFVLVFSSESNKSPQVLREVERAVSVGLTVVPVRLQDVTPSKDIAYFISSVHWLDAMTPPIERQLEDAARKIKAMLGTVAPPGPRQTAPPKQTSSKVLIVGVSVAACVLAGAAIWGFGHRKKHGGDLPSPPVPVPEKESVKPPTVTLSSVEADQGANAQLQADAKGPTPITYVWQTEDSSGAWATIKSGDESTLKFKTLGLGDDKRYRVIATSASGAATSEPARIVVRKLEPPVITRQPENVVCKEGQPAEFRTEVQGKGLMTHQWQIQKNQGEWKSLSASGDSSLSLAKVSSDDAGRYRLIGANVGGASTSTPASLSVVAVKPVKFTRQPTSLTVSPGDRAVLEASVEGDGVGEAIWEFQAKGDSSWRSVAGAAGLSLVIASIAGEHEGSYRCVIEGPTGATVSQPAAVMLVAARPSLDIFCQNSAQANQIFVGDQIISALTNSLSSGGTFKLKNPPQKFSGRPRTSADYVCTVRFRTNAECKRTVDRSSGNKPLFCYNPMVSIEVLWEIDRASGERVAGDRFVISKVGDRFVTAPNENAREIAEAKGLYPNRDLLDEARRKLLDQFAALKIPQ
jgi:hypothetical protein